MWKVVQVVPVMGVIDPSTVFEFGSGLSGKKLDLKIPPI